MNKKHIEIFRICKVLTQLLGDKEAIADLKLLYERHKEMFKDMQDVRDVMNKVVSAPEIVVNASRNNEQSFKALKRLDNEKMGDVVIKNANEVNKIFHVNKKKISEFNRMESQIKTGSRDAHFLHPDLKPTWAGSKEHLPANKTLAKDSQHNKKDSKQSNDCSR